MKIVKFVLLRQMTYKEILSKLDIGMTSIQTIRLIHFSIKKVCFPRIPHCLTGDKNGIINWCLEILERYHEGTYKDVYNIITGDQTWIYC